MLANPLGVKNFSISHILLALGDAKHSAVATVREALQSLQVGAYFRSDLIAKIAIFFESFIDDALFTRPAIPNSE
jgi:hypothetical protein